MKHSVYIIICVLMGCLTSGGCEKAPSSDIEGHWQLLEFTTIEDNETHECERIYYSIQVWVVEVAEKQGSLGLKSFRGRYSYDEESNTVSMTDMSTYDTPENSVPAEVSELEPYGLNSVNTVFDVISVDRHSMVLESDYARLTFKKF